LAATLIFASVATVQTLTVLYTFTAASDGGYPHRSLLRHSQGNLYGTTFQGGSAGDGVVFKLTTTDAETLEVSPKL
jgi:uncharacterized repeat protein (TIGR03803 family)